MAVYPFERLKDEYSRKWDAMTINNNRVAAMEKIADRIIGGKDRYQRLEKVTNVPWYFIGLLHFRESSCNFTRHLHNGDPLSGKTYRVPAGRIPGKSPPYTFEESAIDALAMMGYTKIKNWTIEQIAYRSEMFNGFGYRMNGVPSAYLWAGTNQYVKGKYIRDGVFDRNVVDTQQGTMGVLKIILDKTSEVPVTEEADAVIEEIAIEAPKATVEPPSSTVMNQVSRKYWWNDWLKWLGFGTAGGSGIYKTAQTIDLEVTKTTMQTIKDIAEIVGAFGIMALGILLVIYTIFQSSLMKKDVAEGRAIPSGEIVPPVVTSVEPMENLVS